MRESRIIILVILGLMIIIMPIFYMLSINILTVDECFNIATNLYCGLIVGLITAICQYCVAKRRIVNTVYSLYFDLYRAYHYSKNKSFLFHYNAFSVYKKMIELSPKLSEILDEYHGFIKEKDTLYRKMNPQINLKDYYKSDKIIKTLLLWFNKRPFDYFFGNYISEVEKILTDINSKKFEQDKKEMKRMFNYMWN